MRSTIVLVAAALMMTGCSKPASLNGFLGDAIKGDNSESRLGALAAKKGGAAVRAYGATLHSDHIAGRVKAVEVAGHHGVAATEAMMPEAVKELKKLDRLDGDAFDQEFARYMVHDHESDVAEFSNALKRDDFPQDVRSFAQQTLPVLQKHLDMAKRLS